MGASNIPRFMTSSFPCTHGVRRAPGEAEPSVGVGDGGGGMSKGL